MKIPDVDKLKCEFVWYMKTEKKNILGKEKTSKHVKHICKEKPGLAGAHICKKCRSMMSMM